MLTIIKNTSIITHSLKNQYYLVLFFLISISLLPFSMSSAYHDSQRLIMVFALSITSIYNLTKINKQPKKLLIVFGCLFAWGGVITLNSLAIEWSVIEFFLFTTVATTIITTNYNDHRLSIRIFALTFALVQALYITRSFLNYSFILINQDKLDVWNVIDGFSNIRFYAQFLSWTLPFILAYAYTNTTEKYRNLLLSIVIASWILVLMSGTRAFILGILVSIIAVAWFTPRLWMSYTKGMLFTGLFGLLGYFLLIYLLPALTGLDNSAALNSTANRDFMNSSGRITIWQDTLTIIINNPFMGIGPMMTAMEGVLDKVAHPHNFPLQLAAEWGIPFATVILLSLLYASLRWRNAIKKSPEQRESLALPITAATSSAMSASLVDGIVVMPVSLFYMTVIVGLGFSLWRQWSLSSDWVKISKIAVYFLITIPLSLSIITTMQWQNLANNNSPSNRLEPRFWADGKIKNSNKVVNNHFSDN